MLQIERQLPDIRWPSFRPGHNRQSRVVRILPVGPQCISVLLCAGQLKPSSTVTLCHCLDYLRGLFKRCRRRALELEEKTVGDGVLSRRHAVPVDGVDEDIINELNAF